MTDLADIVKEGYKPMRDHRDLRPQARTVMMGYRFVDRDRDGIPVEGEYGSWDHSLYWDRIVSKRQDGLWSYAAASQTVGSKSATKARPIWTRKLDPDTRFLEMEQVEKGKASPPSKAKAWDKQFVSATDVEGRRLAGKLPGIMLAGTHERAQENVFFPVGNVLIADHRGPVASQMSTVCWDVNATGDLDETYNAGISSAVRVKHVPGVLGSGNALCLNFTRAGKPDEIGYGAIVATPDRSVPAPLNPGQAPKIFTAVPTAGQTCALLSYERGGPIHVGHGRQDKHVIAKNDESEPWNSAHIWTNAMYYMDQNRDAPLEFRADNYEKAQVAQFPVEVHLRYDPAAQHSWRGRQRQGLWRWETFIPFTVPPRIPPDEPPEIPPPPPEQPEVTRIPKKGDSPQQTVLDSPDKEHKLYRQFVEERERRLGPRRIAKPLRFEEVEGVRTPNEVSSASYSFRAQPHTTNSKLRVTGWDLRYQNGFTDEQLKRWSEYPTVARLDSFAKEKEGSFTKVGNATNYNRGGEAAGGVAVMPPNLGIQHVKKGSTARQPTTVPATYLAALKSRIAIAEEIDLENGRPTTGHELVRDTAANTTIWRSVSSALTETNLVTWAEDATCFNKKVKLDESLEAVSTEITATGLTTLDETHLVVEANAGSGNQTIRVDSATTLDGRIYVITRTDSTPANSVTIDSPASFGGIDGGTLSLLPGDTYLIQASVTAGDQWNVLLSAGTGPVTASIDWTDENHVISNRVF